MPHRIILIADALTWRLA